jgi:hypothetical protein
MKIDLRAGGREYRSSARAEGGGVSVGWDAKQDWRVEGVFQLGALDEVPQCSVVRRVEKCIAV